MDRNVRAKDLKIKLLQKNITQRSIAKALGLSESYISMLIKGERTNEDFNWWVSKNL
jgi:transcriptional regulator with XRE-family HTH domain